MLDVAFPLANYAEMIAQPSSFPTLVTAVVARGMCAVVHIARNSLVLSSTNDVFSVIQGGYK